MNFKLIINIITCFLLCSPLVFHAQHTHTHIHVDEINMSLNKNAQRGIGVFEFKLVNTGTHAVYTTDVGINYNRILLVDENGKQWYIYSWDTYLEPPVQIARQSEKIWELDLKPYLDVYRIPKNMKYEFFWELHGKRSKPQILDW